jgi:hypothetical protein
MSAQQPGITAQSTRPQRTSRWAGWMVLVGWWLLAAAVSAFSLPAVRVPAADLLLVRLVFLCSAVVLLTIALILGGRATRLSAMLGVGFAAFLLYCIIS